MTRILVTGASGMIGKAVVIHLLENGFPVIGTCLVSQLKINLSNFEAVNCDLSDEKQSSALLRVYAPSCIVHCAAVVGKSFSEEDPSGPINEKMDNHIIEYCRKSGTKLIYMSGTSVYAPSTDVISESSETRPVGSYLKAKKVSEDKIVKTLRSYVVLRVCAPYHFEQRASTVLKIFIENAMADKPLLYHGSGSRKQWFTSMEDVSELTLLAIRHDVNGIYNVVGPGSISMKELAHVVKEVVTWSTSEVRPSGSVDPEENSSPKYSVEKAARDFGWAPHVTIRQGIADWVARRKLRL